MKLAEHPFVPLPEPEDLENLRREKGLRAVKDLMDRRERVLRLAEEDPLNHGFALEPWERADALLGESDTVLCMGGNRSSKTAYGARSVVRAAIENPESEIVCFAQDADASVRIQQRAVYNYLPPEYKRKSKSEVEYLNFTYKNGFTGHSFILPNGSAVYFHQYSQFIANRGKFEGLEIGSVNPEWNNIGLWLDEYLEDGDLVNTMRFRLATRNAKMILTFTPIEGYTPFVASFLADAETRRTRNAELLRGQSVPYVQYSHAKDAGIVYFHSDQNPFGGYERIKKELRDSSREEILTRAYGIPVKSVETLFPMFSTGTHVTKDNPDVSDRGNWTVYQVVDPAFARNYACIWAAVDRFGRVHVLREWPDKDSYGDWAVRGDPKWKYGPAAKKLGYDVNHYCELFREIEEEIGVEPFERVGDSRFFAKENEDCADLFGRFADHGIEFIPSYGGDENKSLVALDQWFHWNPNAEMDEANRPLLTIHESCGNLIDSIINYGAQGKNDEALKDWIDVLRYLRMINGGDGPDFVDERHDVTTKPSWGY